MPCQDSSSSLTFRIDHQDRFLCFEFAKITCSQSISGETGLGGYCKGKALTEILDLDFFMLRSFFHLEEQEERSFILYLELDALKSAIAQYLGIQRNDIDAQRSVISSIACEADHTEVVLVVLPPKELPKIIPCSLRDDAA